MFLSALYGEDPVSDLSYTCYGLHACFSYMCTGSALDVMDYGLAKAESSVKELIARMPLILRISPS